MKDSRPRSYSFVFERREFALLLAGFVIILVLTFLLGTVVGRRSMSHLVVAERESSETSPVAPPQEPDEAAPTEPVAAVEQPPEPAEVPPTEPVAAVERPQEVEGQLQIEEEELTFFSTLPDSGADQPPPAEQPPAPSAPSESAPSSPPQEVPPEQTRASQERPEEVAAPQQAPQQGPYLIQVGSFRDQASALSLARRLKAKGYPAVVREVKLAGKGRWYRVRVEGYPEEAAAEHVARMLREREKLSVLVLRGGR